jgi:hypothetical protein
VRDQQQQLLLVPRVRRVGAALVLRLQVAQGGGLAPQTQADERSPSRHPRRVASAWLLALRSCSWWRPQESLTSSSVTPRSKPW